LTYPHSYRSQRANWGNLNILFGYPHDIRVAGYTINAIESPISVVRKIVNKRKMFPSDDPARKLNYMAISEASWAESMPT